MGLFDDLEPADAVKRKSATHHEIGQSLDALSLHEIAERIEILKSEIERLEVAKTNKQASLRAADSAFKI